MFMQIKGCSIVLFLIFQTLSYSQPRLFQHITNKDGISQSEVYTFLEDSRGFMWFGTVDGLNRYDGYSITIFNTDKNNPNSISNNTIRSLAEDCLGRIWIGTDDGLCVYNPLSEKIFQIGIGFIDEDVLLHINSIIVDKNFLILGTSLGLLRAKINTTDLEQIGQNFQVVKYSKTSQSRVYDATLCKNGSIWFITADALIGIVFQSETTDPWVIDNIADKELGNNVGVEEDKSGNIWIITHTKGFFRYNPSTKRMDRFSENFPNRSIVSDMYSSAVTDKNDNLWLATRDKGLLFLDATRLNDKNPQFENIQNIPFADNSLNSNLIYSLYVSKNNLLWVGTIGMGINIYDPQQKEFNHQKIPLRSEEVQSSSNFIRSVFNDNKDNIWLGTHNNGLYIFNRKNNTFRKAGFGNHSIFYICDIGGDITLICNSSGYSLVRLVNNKVKIISNVNSSAHFYAVKSKNDVLWLASLIGLTRCRIESGVLQAEKMYNINTDPGISFNNCRVLCYNEEKNELLLGTEGGGLNILKLDEQQNVTSVKVFKKTTSPNSISNNYIRSITRDSNSDFWIGTYEGLNRLLYDSLSGEITFKSFTKTDGLPNNMIQLIIEDNQKMLWIGTNGGLSRFDSKNNHFVNYSASEGLQSNEFSEHTVLKNANGEIILGGTEGINIFNPENIRTNNIPPKTTITGFYLFNKKVEIPEGKKRSVPLRKSIVLTDTILLNPSQTSFAFDFSAMLYSNPGKVNYAYMLEGFDKEWNYTDAKNRNANYTNLRHGKYIFKVKSTNIDGIWEEIPRQIYINIRTPFIYTWVAFVIYILAILLIIIYLTNYSVIKYTTKKKILLENDHNRKLHELDELRNRFFINISHDLRTPLTLISSPLDLALKEKDLPVGVRNHLSLAQQNVKKLRYITEQILDFNKSEAGVLSPKRQFRDIISFIKIEATHFSQAVKSKGLDLYVLSNEAVINTAFDADMISKVMFNLLSNSVKFTHKGEIKIRIEKTAQELPERLRQSKFNSFIKVEIQDTGEGIDQHELDIVFDRFYQGKDNKEKGFGIGLSHCKDLIEALDGMIEATSEKGVGTTIRFYIPDIIPEDNLQEMEFIPSNSEDLYIEAVNDNTGDDTFPDNASIKKILLIEDNPDMRCFIRNELKKEYKVFEAKDGIEGLEISERFSPDLIISDIMMPRLNGLELCKKLKSDIRTSHIPVILLTAKTDTPTKYHGIELGADDYISKPFEMEYLLLRIKNLLKTREQLQRLFQINNSLDPSAVTVSSLDERFLSQLMKELENGISDPDFTVNSLESKMGMSHSNFYRKIKSLTGQSGKDILLNMRMKRAKQILTDNKGIRISEVAYMVGYVNPKYFSHNFKDFYGVLPSDIAK